MIYLIQAGERTGSPVKVGFSVKPEERLALFQCGNPEPLKLLGTFQGEPTTERRLHRVLSPLRHRGEWFKPQGDLLQSVVQRMCDDPEALKLAAALMKVPLKRLCGILADQNIRSAEDVVLFALQADAEQMRDILRQAKIRGPVPKPPEQLRQTITIRVTQAELQAIEHAAQLSQQPARTWAARTLATAAKRAINRAARQQ